MKLYRIIKRNGVWQALAGEPERVIATSDDRDSLITLARKIAARHHGEIYISDETGKLEILFSWSGIGSISRVSSASLGSLTRMAGPICLWAMETIGFRIPESHWLSEVREHCRRQ